MPDEPKGLFGTRWDGKLANAGAGISGVGVEGGLTGILQPHVRGNLIEHFERSGLGLHRKSREQQIVANRIDETRDALRANVNLFEELGSKDGLVFQTGAGHARVDVSEGFLKVEAAKGAAQRDALLELAELRGVHLAIQFLLAGENDLEHLAAAVLEVAEEADFFQDVPPQVVRLIDDEYGSASGGGPLQEH